MLVLFYYYNSEYKMWNPEKYLKILMYRSALSQKVDDAKR